MQEALVKLSTYSLVGIEVIFIFVAEDNFVPKWIRWSGLLLTVIATYIFILAMKEMGLNWRAGLPESMDTELVQSGVYKWSRNPAFLAFDLTYIGYLLAFFHFVMIPFVFWGLIQFHLQILKEESYCKNRFGKSYINYSNKVPRYL